MGGANSSRFPGTAMSYAIQCQEIPADGNTEHPAFYQNRTLSFDSDTSGNTSSSMSSFSGGEQGGVFTSANESFDDSLDFGAGMNNGLVFGSDNDNPKRSYLTSGMGLLNFDT